MSNYLNMGDVSIAMDAYVYGLSSHAKILVRPIVKKKLGPNSRKMGKLSGSVISTQSKYYCNYEHNRLLHVSII